MIIFLLICWGLSNTIVNESVFKKYVDKIKTINNFLKGVFSCSTCFGFYIGCLLYILLLIIGIEPILSGLWLLDILFSGIISSGVINIIEHIKIRIGG